MVLCISPVTFHASLPLYRRTDTHCGIEDLVFETDFEYSIFDVALVASKRIYSKPIEKMTQILFGTKFDHKNSLIIELKE